MKRDEEPLTIEQLWDARDELNRKENTLHLFIIVSWVVGMGVMVAINFGWI